MQPPGLTFGRYLLVERIAAGGMGEVYVALQTGIGRFTRPLAVKLLLPHLADDERVVSMFLDEARVGAQMSHANIAQVYDVGQDHERYFIAMELVRGVSLSGLIAALKGKKEQLSASVLAHIGRSLAEGLHVAHEQKGGSGKALELIHRDVTPHNILVSVDGAVKLTDFGIAHVADADRQSRPGMVMGKLGYLAPEQILGKPLDRRVDLFAAGATLYHLAALERPFDTPTGAVLDPLRLPTVPLRVARPDLPRELVDAIEKALENDVERRFASAKELRNALPVPPPEAAEELGALVRRLCAESIEALEAKTERATRAVLNQQLPETKPSRAAVARGEQQTASVSAQLATPLPLPAPVRKRFPVLALALAAVALVSVGVVVKVMNGGGEPVPSVPPAAPLPIPPPVAAQPAVTPTPQPVPVQPEPTRPPAHHDTSPGTLAVDAAPWGEVEVDGKKVGETPLAGLKLSPGTHQLVVKNPDNGKSVRRTVTIAAGKPTATRVDLR